MTPTVLLKSLPAVAPGLVPFQETPEPKPTCLDNMGCKWIYDVTGESWLAESSYVILLKPLKIVLILLVAMVARFLLHRAINRLVRTTSKGSVPTILRPLRERIPTAMVDSGVFPERRRQRAEAVGSVLRSAVTAVVFSIATLLVLGELGFNLAPLLASAGIVGVALGFGAQTLVKDLLSGLFMLLEDQYGVGDMIDMGEATGVVEAVGLRITTLRDAQGILWYVRNGEIIRVGNRSQGWTMAIVDMPIGYAGVEEATAVLRQAAASLAEDPEYAADFIDPPEVVGVEQITVDGAVVRTTAKTTADAQLRVVRELRRRLAEALDEAGIAARIAASRMYPRPGTPPGPGATPPGPGTTPPGSPPPGGAKP